MTAEEALLWIQDKLTLSNSFEVRYVVDGYQANLIHETQGVVEAHGETLLGAIVALADKAS
jgi:hypothetical protein